MSYDKFITCEHCRARFVYRDSLDRHRSRCPRTATLLAENRDLKRRISEARRALSMPWPWPNIKDKALAALDLRRGRRGRR